MANPTLFSFLLLIHIITAHSTVEWRCRNTPHPDSCRSNLYKLSVKAAVDLAVHASTRVQRLGKSCEGAAQKTAWLDCCNLFADTVLLLNRTMSRNNNNDNDNSFVDEQTWLSAALTNLNTCNKGFAELNADASFMRPVLRYNLSELISDCLAINSGRMAAAAAWVDEGRVMRVSGGADFVVAQDGSGNFATVKEAVEAAEGVRKSGGRRIVIHVKAGVYAEYLVIGSSLDDLTIIGDGKGKTIITGRRSVALGFTTFNCPTVSIFGDGFMAMDITIRNTYGAGSQAVALLSGSDKSVFYRCSIEGYQDTLCVYTQRQFYRECDIFGTIDFIFGNAAVVIQNCTIFARNPQKGESNVLTAQGRTDQNQNTGIIIQSSKILAAPDLQRSVKSYLGRPWQLYSRTVYMENFIDGIIDPAGWAPFKGNFALDTLYYAEFRNNGPGARVLRLRVKWKGFHVIRRPSEVKKFTVGRFISGGAWLPATGVPFASGF